MSIFFKRASISSPHSLNRTNYPYWKTRMSVFIRATNVRAWRSILAGWTPSMVTDSEGKKILKPEVDWSNDDDCLANYNNKALHAIFNMCDADHIKLISLCETAKEA